MAVLILNPIVNSFSGRDGNAVYYMRRGTQCGRSYIIPPNPDTPAQKNNRGRFGQAVRSWQQLAGEEKNKFAKRAERLNMSGYNLYISEFMKAEKSLDTKPESGQVRDSKLSHSFQQRFRSVSYSFLLPIRMHNASVMHRKYEKILLSNNDTS